MAVVTRFLIERNGTLATDSEGNPLMYADKAEADAVDRRLDAIDAIAEIMSSNESNKLDYDAAYALAESLVERAEDVQAAIKPVIADNKKLASKEK